MGLHSEAVLIFISVMFRVGGKYWNKTSSLLVPICCCLRFMFMNTFLELFYDAKLLNQMWCRFLRCRSKRRSSCCVSQDPRPCSIQLHTCEHVPGAAGYQTQGRKKQEFSMSFLTDELKERGKCCSNHPMLLENCRYTCTGSLKTSLFGKH